MHSFVYGLGIFTHTLVPCTKFDKVTPITSINVVFGEKEGHAILALGLNQ